MISNPSLIFYVSVSKGSTVLAEFNSKDADLGTLADKCLEKTPPLHTFFFHTFRNKTYTFFVDGPFVYFAISHESLESSEGLAFLRTVKTAFNEMIESDPSENFSSHCFQGELSPVFHQLLAQSVEFGTPQSPRAALKNSSSGSMDSPIGRSIGSMPLLGGAFGGKSLKKKKRLSVTGGGGDGENRAGDVCDDGSSREFSIPMQKNGLFAFDMGHHQKAKRVWKKQVWIVLSLDLIVCSILFGIWLWICRGFKCING